MNSTREYANDNSLLFCSSSTLYIYISIKFGCSQGDIARAHVLTDLCNNFFLLYSDSEDDVHLQGLFVCRGRDRMVVGFTTIYAISAYHHELCEFEPCSDEVYSIQHYVIKFVSDLRQVSGFLRVLQFPPPIKLTAKI